MDKIQRHLYENKQQHMAMFDSWVLRGHGIFDTKGAFETLPPLPEKYYEPSVLNIKEENSDLFESSRTPTENSSSAFGQFSPSWSDIGEIFTERSSVFSWRHDDEFDRGAASQVQQIFLDVDSCLYESMETKLSSNLNSECSEWIRSFPYLRLVGTQLLPSNDSGTLMIEVHQEKHNHEHSEKIKQQQSEPAQDPILVNGCKVEAKAAPNDAQFDEGSLLYLEEEVFATDGDIEEFIAYDCSAMDAQTKDFEDKKYYKEAIPPVAPAASIHERVISECFDKVWSKLVYIFADLMKLYAKAKSRKGYSSNYISHYDEENYETFHENRQIPSRSSIQLKTSVGQATSYDQDLKELMKIRPIPLQDRLSFPNIIRDEDHYVSRETVVSRPVSSSIGIHRQFPKSSTFRNAEQIFHDRMASAKVTNKKAVRLQPLSVSKVSSSISQENALLNEIRGKGLQTPQSINQWNSRIVTLPPLERLSINEPIGRIRSSKKSIRVSSAATNDKNNDAYERNTFAIQDSRPNTTHSLRTEILSKKSGFFHNNRPHNDHHSMMSKPFEEENALEFNTFVLWGQPLISTQKSFSQVPQKKSRNGNR